MIGIYIFPIEERIKKEGLENAIEDCKSVLSTKLDNLSYDDWIRLVLVDEIFKMLNQNIKRSQELTVLENSLWKRIKFLFKK